MRTSLRIAPIVAAAWMMLPGVAHAGVEPANHPSWGAAVPDSELALQRGGYSPFSFALTVRNVAEMSDAQNTDMARITGSIARVTMDIWWSSTGAQLIAANVRAMER